MSRRQPFTRALFLPYSQRKNVPADAVVIDVSSYADPPYCEFSPMWPHGGIPVPGQDGVTSDSVEGIWQGLKVIRGRTNPKLFQGKGEKRGGHKPSGHQYGDDLLNYQEARLKIFQPAYEWMLANRIAPPLIEEFVERAFSGVTQYFHDVGDNGNIHNLNENFAHAALVAQYVNRLCQERTG